MQNQKLPRPRFLFRIKPFTELKDNPVFLKQINHGYSGFLQKHLGLNFFLGRILRNISIFFILFFVPCFYLMTAFKLNIFILFGIFWLVLFIIKLINMFFQSDQLKSIEKLSDYLKQKSKSGELGELNLTELSGREIIWGLCAPLILSEYLSLILYLLFYILLFIISNYSFTNILLIFGDNVLLYHYAIILFILHFLSLYPAIFSFSLIRQIEQQKINFVERIKDEIILFLNCSAMIIFLTLFAFIVTGIVMFSIFLVLSFIKLLGVDLFYIIKSEFMIALGVIIFGVLFYHALAFHLLFESLEKLDEKYKLLLENLKKMDL